MLGKDVCVYLCGSHDGDDDRWRLDGRPVDDGDVLLLLAQVRGSGNAGS